jgi:signal transduction histidine kinase
MPVLIAILAALVAGGAVAWVLLPKLLRLQRQQRAMAKALGRLGHDLRGALAPALLLAERLETHQDNSVRQASQILMQTIDRAASLAKSVATLTPSEAEKGLVSPAPASDRRNGRLERDGNARSGGQDGIALGKPVAFEEGRDDRARFGQNR